MIIRIFLPESVYRLKSIVNSECYHIFGKIVSDICEENISIFIVDVYKSNEQRTSDQQLIGTISKYNRDVGQTITDHIAFDIDEIKSTLNLKTVHLPNFITFGAPFRIHILLYDYKQFLELSQRIDVQKWCQRQDSISKLLITIRNKDDFEARDISSHCDKANGYRLIFILMSLSAFAQTKLSFLNSSFLKHFHFWTSNLEKLTHKK